MKLNLSAFYTAVALGGSSLSLPATPINPMGPYYDSPNGGNPLLNGEEIIASGGDVTLTFLGPTTAIYNDVIFLASPANGFGMFFPNHTTPNGATIDLGNYAAGTELEFGIYAANSGQTWYSGPDSRNSDGAVHAYLVNNYEGLADTVYVGFEDLGANAGSDWNYVDHIFAVSGATVPDAVSTASLLGFSFCGLMSFRRFLSSNLL
jgi:hypothetical protein